jgi:hypothetical protein
MGASQATIAFLTSDRLGSHKASDSFGDLAIVRYGSARPGALFFGAAALPTAHTAGRRGSRVIGKRLWRGHDERHL